MNLNKSYEEILESLKTTYFDGCGSAVRKGSELEKRFEAVASELFAISCYGDFILKQALPSTATGEYLDMHGQARDCARKTASAARGSLTFGISEAAAQDILIPQGTVCSVSGKPFIQFETVSDAVLPAGELSVTVEARALADGKCYNAEAGAVCVMVNAPLSIESVTNETAFCGGCDEESDASYRKRMLSSFRIPVNGAGKASTENAVMQLDYVTDCLAADTDTPGYIYIVVTTKTGTLSTAQKNEIASTVELASMVGAIVRVSLAEEESVDLSLELYCRYGSDTASIISQAESAAAEVFDGLKIGEPLQLSSLAKALLAIDGVEKYSIHSPQSVGDTVNCSARDRLVQGSTAVSCYEL